MTPTREDVQALKSILDRHSKGEKHIGYHILPERFNALLKGTEHENRYVFSERERFQYFQSQIDFRNKRVVDIGCNIGYFLFSILDAGASYVTGYEGKRSCGEFLDRALKLIDRPDQFEFHNTYCQFGSGIGDHDVGLLLNVLHHLGDDYGSQSIGKAEARQGMLRQLNALSSHIGTLILQMGFNWKGDRFNCLFEHGTKTEMIDYVSEGTQGYWAVEHIGIARRRNGVVFYEALDDINVAREDALGEFLNRPIFILRSLKRLNTAVPPAPNFQQ